MMDRRGFIRSIGIGAVASAPLLAQSRKGLHKLSNITLAGCAVYVETDDIEMVEFTDKVFADPQYKRDTNPHGSLRLYCERNNIDPEYIKSFRGRNA